MRHLMIALLLSACLTPAFGDQVITTLRADNPSAIARPAVPITCGVPLPAGVVRDVDRLALRAGGAEMPAQFAPMVRGRDGSVRWVQVDTVLNLPADGAAVVELVRRDVPDAGAAPIAREDAGRILVQTGRLTLQLDRATFNFPGQAWLSPKGDGVIDPDYHALDGGAGGPTASHGKDLWRGEGRPTVAIERSGPVAATVVASGKLGEDAGQSMTWQVRMTFYRGLGVVRIGYRWIKDGGQREQRLTFQRLGFDVPTALPAGDGPYTLQIGGADGPHTGPLAADGDKALIAHDTPERYVLGGSMIGNGAGREGNVSATGWVAVDNGKVGVAVGRRYFWQMAPADIIVVCDTDKAVRPLISMGLYSDRTERDVRAYTGTARSHELYLALFEADDRRQVAARMLDLTEPATLRAPADYYARATEPLSPLAPTAASDYMPDARPAAVAVDKQLGLLVDWWNFNRTRREGVSAYQYRYFGDFPAGRSGDGPRDVLWAGNAYDFPHVCLSQWLRTGEAKFLSAFGEAGGQLLDVHTVLADPDPDAVGATRHSPAGDQVLLRGRPYVSPGFAHLHARGLLERALLSADPWALKVAWAAIGRAADYEAADSLYNQPASVGNQLLALVAAWRLTGRAEYLDRCKRIVGFARRFQDRYDGLYFPRETLLPDTAVTCEGMLDYFRASGDAAAVDSVRRHVAALVAGGKLEEEALAPHAKAFAYPLAFLAAYDSKPAWRKLAIDLLSRPHPHESLADFTRSFRGVQQALHYLSNAGSNDPALQLGRE